MVSPHNAIESEEVALITKGGGLSAALLPKSEVDSAKTVRIHTARRWRYDTYHWVLKIAMIADSKVFKWDDKSILFSRH
jgi:hypothetical protein